ncbi:DUF4870 family protein [Silvanigrella aquatica]|uniref:DUF4870 domain-containing protein n=1 Tax=Silvanigrella aquatica TaxID=1915309 RepID=A0A1L4CXJ4_9BACT|nr:hypothetical protein [Silvanigrella aquatica]APJ02664.1 hypothetical protein AXG55_01440 [Silvanigrella aquatica]
MQHNNYFNNSSSHVPVKNSTQNIVTAVYILQLVSIFTAGLFALIPLLMCYLFRHQAKGSWLDGHFRWQIQTFWFSVLFFALAWLFGLIPFLGWLISVPCFLLGVAVILVRTFKGWKKLNIQKPPQNLIE